MASSFRSGGGGGVGVRAVAPRRVEEKMGQREGAGVQRRGPAWHRRGGSGLLRQWRAAHTSRAWLRQGRMAGRNDADASG
jgi:hypothetical protein